MSYKQVNFTDLVIHNRLKLLNSYHKFWWIKFYLENFTLEVIHNDLFVLPLEKLNFAPAMYVLEIIYSETQA